MKGFAVLLLMIVILVPAALHAQPHDMKASEGRAEGPASSQYRERLDKLTGTSPQPRTEGVKPVIPSPPDPVGLDPKTNERYQASLQRYYEYLFSGFEHRQRVFEWQLLSSKIIFAVVLVLVFAGIYFAAVQFHVAQREKAKGEPTQLEASLSGIKVSSSVLGVIILVISLLFFYLYLVHVYPISEIL